MSTLIPFSGARDDKMDFSDILASTIHDTKNSLGMLLNTLEEMVALFDDREEKNQFFQLQYEIKRLNNSLIRLLSLYKAEKSQLAAHIDYHSVNEFIEDIAQQYEQLFNSRGIDLEVAVPDGLFWAFDRGLITGVLDNVLNNAFRYAKDKIRLCAACENGCLALHIADNGAGYPENMLVYGMDHPRFKENVSFDTGSTGLGLYFSSLVAKMHARGERAGYITLTNGGDYGGGCFSLFLPP